MVSANIRKNSGAAACHGLLVLLSGLLLFVASCHPADPKQVDVHQVSGTLRSVRFDQELFACDTSHLFATASALANKYPAFANVYFKELTGLARRGDDSLWIRSLHHFLTYKDYRGLYDTVQAHYHDVKDIHIQLEDLIRHVRYYFPDEKTNEVYYFISGLNNWSAVTVDNALAIGLDMYLGKNYPFYPSVQLPEYEIKRCEKAYIPINAAKVLFENRFPQNPEGRNLLELMIAKGKQLLFMEYVLPAASDEFLMGYSPAQLKWCKDNEAMIWNFFSARQLLYSTDWQDMMRYVNDGPTSTGMPPESPGNIGSWTGWQLVRCYLKNHPDLSLQQLLNDHSDAQTFLRTSGYKP